MLTGKRVKIVDGTHVGEYAHVQGETPYYPDGETVLVTLEDGHLPRNVKVDDLMPAKAKPKPRATVKLKAKKVKRK
jgi:hypothetical protein